MTRSLHYITGYVLDEDLKLYRTAPSGNDKSDYIKEALLDAGYNIKIVSALESNTRFLSYVPRKKLNVQGYNHVYLSCLGGCGNLCLKCISRLWLYLSLILYCIKNINRDDIVLFYHTTPMMRFIKYFFWCIRGKIYLEVEELYGALIDDQKLIDEEIRFCNTFSGGYIFVNDLIKEDLDIRNLPYAICYGRYKSNQIIIPKKSNHNNKIIISYAGLVDSIKYTDAFRAVELARFLPDDYLVSIIGYGDEKAIKELVMKIDSVNNDFSTKKVSYDGCLSGDDLLVYYSKVSYGLCLRDTKDKYDKYTFPSKVFVYINHGIIPICTRIRPLLYSSIAENILFVDDTNMQDTAQQIMANIGMVTLVDTSYMHNKFVSSLKMLFR